MFVDLDYRFTRTQTVTHPSTNPAVHGRASNSQPVDYKSHILTTTPLIGSIHGAQPVGAIVAAIVTAIVATTIAATIARLYTKGDCRRDDRQLVA